VPPIYQTSIFTFPTYQELVAALAAENTSTIYARGRNPTVAEVERRLARLERGEDCKLFASGMGAISAVMLGLLEAGDHVLFVGQVYGPTLQLAQHLARLGIRHDHLRQPEGIEAIAAALRPETRMIWAESPGTMTFELLDLSAIAELARARGIVTVIDNSWATPLLQKPLTHGFDIVVHTCSKYIGGHSDTVAGAVISSAARIEQIFYRAFLLNGAAVGPVDAWLILRGLRTLPVRLAQVEASAFQVIDYLQQHPRVARVFHPSLDPRRELVTRHLRGFSGLLSFELSDAGYDDVCAVLNRLRLFNLAISWGGFESLAVAVHRGNNAESLRDAGLPPGLIRLSVGLEPVEALIADLDQALEC
jgi:cystathionine beta-lyase